MDSGNQETKTRKPPIRKKKHLYTETIVARELNEIKINKKNNEIIFVLRSEGLKNDDLFLY